MQYVVPVGTSRTRLARPCSVHVHQCTRSSFLYLQSFTNEKYLCETHCHLGRHRLPWRRFWLQCLKIGNWPTLATGHGHWQLSNIFWFSAFRGECMKRSQETRSWSRQEELAGGETCLYAVAPLEGALLLPGHQLGQGGGGSPDGVTIRRNCLRHASHEEVDMYTFGGM